ncbi:YwqG family protein [Phenylobacterium sp.]|uniref:YwqG family protein n=1 Tax=Phenylobacterium sp. TaxID=1871053 RepID=UPI002F3FDC94
MKRLARPTLLLTPTKDPGFCKLGGDPELPHHMAWPTGERAPRAFLAQIDLAEAAASRGLDWLPEAGRLYAFYDDQRLGFGDTVQILHSPDPPGPPRAPPAGLAAKMRFPDRRVGFLPLSSMPSLDWLGMDVVELDIGDQALDALADLSNEPFGDELQHRIGGYPGEIQGTNMRLACEHLARGLKYDPQAEVPPAIERASKSWRLLLQIDSDPALRMNWGDGGRLYIFVRAQHARAGDFSKTVTLTETY